MLQVGTTTVVQVGLWVTTAQWTLLQHQNVIIDISCYEKKIVVGISTVDNQHQIKIGIPIYFIGTNSGREKLKDLSLIT